MGQQIRTSAKTNLRCFPDGGPGDYFRTKDSRVGAQTCRGATSAARRSRIGDAGEQNGCKRLDDCRMIGLVELRPIAQVPVVDKLDTIAAVYT